MTTVSTGAIVPTTSSPPQTLLQLRSKLQRRLGFAAAGMAAGVNAGNLESILENAQLELYLEFSWSFLDVYVDKQIGVDQTLLNYPPELNADRISAVAVNYSSQWKNLDYGIKTEHYSTIDQPSVPARYQFRNQVEFWPASNGVYDIRFFGMAPLLRFEQDGDYCTLDANVVFLYALSTAKAHYRQPDATLIANQWERVKGMLKGKAHKQRSYGGGVQPNAGQAALEDTYPWPKPVVVGR